MQYLGYLFTAMPFLVAFLLAIGMLVLALRLYPSFGVGLGLMATTFVLDVMTQSTPILQLGVTLYIADVPMLLVGVMAATRWVMHPSLFRQHWPWLIFALVFLVNLSWGLATQGTSAGVQARNDFYALAAASYVLSFPIAGKQVRQLIAALCGVSVVLTLITAYRWTVYYGNITDLLPAAGTYNIDGAIRVIGASPALILAQAALLGLFFGNQGRAALSLRIGLPLLLGLVLALQHRSVWLATFAGVASSLLLARAQRVSSLRQLALVSVAACMVVGVLLFGGRLTQEVSASAARGIQGEGTVHARFENWRVTLDDWRSAGPRAIMIGREYGSDMVRTVINSDGERVRFAFGAHNNYISTLTSFGVIGLGALLWALARACKGLFARCRSGTEDSPDAALLLVLMSMQLVYYVAYSTDLLQFLIFGVALAYVSHRKEVDPAGAASKVRQPGFRARRSFQSSL